MVNPKEIILKYYSEDSELFHSLWIHSNRVAEKAQDIVSSAQIDCDIQFVTETALLHDIGIFKCNAPDIHCHGTLPYICHGVEGRKILEAEGLPRHALVCERHTGSGLTSDDIISQRLPLPARDMLPLTIEEKIICYADNFFSKSGNLTEEKSIDAIIAQLNKHSQEAVKRFIALHNLFTNNIALREVL